MSKSVSRLWSAGTSSTNQHLFSPSHCFPTDPQRNCARTSSLTASKLTPVHRWRAGISNAGLLEFLLLVPIGLRWAAQRLLHNGECAERVHRWHLLLGQTLLMGRSILLGSFLTNDKDANKFKVFWKKILNSQKC